MRKFKHSKDYANEMERKAFPVFKMVGFALLALTMVTLVGFGFKLLWNSTMPEIFGLPQITFWKGVALLFLSKIIFGGIAYSSNNDSKNKSFGKEVKSYVSDALHEEMQEAFVNNYVKKYGDHGETDDTALNLEDSTDDPDALYEKWWQDEGETYFDNYLQEKSST